ncbi:uncharacterized protein UTRI_02382 [Ustilago trichophora]|uniref:BZIP domain-containing protein n=1 Tax=Ustilago trichophora TaxID=86804 RepID=A0A5C3E904_9BASI|nr:uncharacterized protein UTRI_02382 [Ustilago trichophora]
MRSSATAGLTPQQLLDRRRAQNKLAQRRFREKARMARAAGSASSASYLAAAASAMPTFPPHLDLTAPSMMPRMGHGRIRSASSDSSCSTSSVSLSSQVSSPSSSCTELNTPTMPTLTAAHPPPPVTFLSSTGSSNPATAPVFVAEIEPKSDLALIEGAFRMPPPPHFATNSPSVTYSSLASSSTPPLLRFIVALAQDGWDAFRSFPYKSTSSQPFAPLGPSGNNPSMLSGAMFFAPPHESQSMLSTSFENLLRIPSRPSTCSNASSDATSSEEPCLSPPSSSSTSTTHTTPSLLTDTHQAITTHNRTQASQSASFHLGKAISEHATQQLLYPHRAFIDACLPWAAVRSRLLKHALTNPVCEEELALDLLLSILSPDETVASFTVYGDDILDPEAWELSQHMLNKWWGLFDDSAIRRSNWWRRQRGLKDLVIPVSTGTTNLPTSPNETVLELGHSTRSTTSLPPSSNEQYLSLIWTLLSSLMMDSPFFSYDGLSFLYILVKSP